MTTLTGGAGGKGPDVQKWQWTPHGMAAANDNSISWVEGRDYDALAAELEAVRAEWFKKGQDAVLRRNESGCCCKIDEDGETILSPCLTHKVWADAKLAKEHEHYAALLKHNQAIAADARMWKQAHDNLMPDAQRAVAIESERASQAESALAALKAERAGAA